MIVYLPSLNCWKLSLGLPYQSVTIGRIETISSQAKQMRKDWCSMNYFRFEFGKIRRVNKIGDSWEMWKRIKVDGIKTDYEVSNFGRVRNMNTYKIKVPYYRSDGYLYVQLHVGKRLRMINVHRLVAIAFISNPNNKPQVNHIDGIKVHNMVNNLEWVTNSENIRHAIDNGLLKIKSGINAKHTVYTKEQIEHVINLLKLKNLTSKEISEITKVGISTVCYIRNGKSYAEMSERLGFVPDTKHNFDFSSYEKDIRILVEAGLKSREIRKNIPLNVSNEVYNHFIRKIRKICLEGSTTIQTVPWNMASGVGPSGG